MACLQCLCRWAKPDNGRNESHLPSDYEEILKRWVTPLEYKSKEELYSLLCDGILIDGGRKWFSFEKLTGKKCYILSARELAITWGDDIRYWKWKSLPRESRFSEVAALVDVCWLNIEGKIDSRMLSPKTYYGAYIILKFEIGDNRLDVLPSEVSVAVGDQVSSGSVYLRPNYNMTLLLERLKFLHSLKVLSTIPPEVIKREEVKGRGGGRKEAAEEGERPKRTVDNRADGWMEVELGKFSIDEGDEGEVKMVLREIKGNHWKRGLIIEGIELRPLDSLLDNSMTALDNR